MDDTLAAQVGQALKARGLMLALAESTTGGLIAHRLTNVAGCSTYLQGGAVAYSNDTKEKVLGVSPHTLLTHGAVSREVALEMARGARRLFGADLAVGVTGIAGPGGVTELKPMGLTFIALSAAEHERVEHIMTSAGRLAHKREASEAALRMILEFVEETKMTSNRLGEAATTVEADWLRDGSVRPRSFTWQGHTHVVSDMGRQWIEGQRRHVLVMTEASETYELVVEMPAMNWRAQRVGHVMQQA